MRPTAYGKLFLFLVSIFYSGCLADDVTLYAIQYTSVSRAIFAPTGEIVTVKPISTGADGSTAYEVQSVVSAIVRIDPTTTFALSTTAGPTTTTYTYIADATQHVVDQHFTRGTDVVTISAKCTNRKEDGSMVCEDRIEVVSDGTSTSVEMRTETGSATPLYTVIEGSAPSGLAGSGNAARRDAGLALTRAALLGLGLVVPLFVC